MKTSVISAGDKVMGIANTTFTVERNAVFQLEGNSFSYSGLGAFLEGRAQDQEWEPERNSNGVKGWGGKEEDELWVGRVGLT